MIDWARAEILPTSTYPPEGVPYFSEPAIEIMGTRYRLALSRDGIELAKADGETHYIIDGPDGHECSCNDCFYRKRACKHLRALRATGLLPEPAPEPAKQYTEADYDMALAAFGLAPICGGSPEAAKMYTVKPDAANVAEVADEIQAIKNAIHSAMMRFPPHHKPRTEEQARIADKLLDAWWEFDNLLHGHDCPPPPPSEASTQGPLPVLPDDIPPISGGSPEAAEAPPVAAPAPVAPMAPAEAHPVLAPAALAAFLVLAALAFAWIVDGSPPRP